jgi:dTDP-4-dehydrorhamnose reductase
MLKILLLGNGGQLGWELERLLQPLGVVIALDFPQINMADPGSIRITVQECRPDGIINATAYTAVDQAESESGLAHAVNGLGPGVLAEEARKLNAFLIHFSTDYVFDGQKGSPYLETDAPNPLNVYGKSKFSGEQAIQAVDCNYLIFRTAWVYSLRRDSFVSKVLAWARKNETLRIVSDQVSNPTWAHSLAEITVRLLVRAGEAPLPWLADRKGLYHLAGDGFASRYEWAQEILALDPNPHEQVTRNLLPAATTEFPAPAVRPLYSALDCEKFKAAFGLHLPNWKQALSWALQK